MRVSFFTPLLAAILSVAIGTNAMAYDSFAIFSDRESPCLAHAQPFTDQALMLRSGWGREFSNGVPRVRSMIVTLFREAVTKPGEQSVEGSFRVRRGMPALFIAASISAAGHLFNRWGIRLVPDAVSLLVLLWLPVMGVYGCFYAIERWATRQIVMTLDRLRGPNHGHRPMAWSRRDRLAFAGVTAIGLVNQLSYFAAVAHMGAVNTSAYLQLIPILMFLTGLWLARRSTGPPLRASIKRSLLAFAFLLTSSLLVNASLNHRLGSDGYAVVSAITGALWWIGIWALKTKRHLNIRPEALTLAAGLTNSVFFAVIYIVRHGGHARSLFDLFANAGLGVSLIYGAMGLINIFLRYIEGTRSFLLRGLMESSPSLFLVLPVQILLSGLTTMTGLMNEPITFIAAIGFIVALPGALFNLIEWVPKDLTAAPRLSPAVLQQPFVEVLAWMRKQEVKEPWPGILGRMLNELDEMSNPGAFKSRMEALMPMLEGLGTLWRDLAKVVRQGAVDREAPIDRVWSVAHHTALMALFFQTYAQTLEIPLTKAEVQLGLAMILLHDIPEVPPWRDSTPQTDRLLWMFGSFLKHRYEGILMRRLIRTLSLKGPDGESLREPWSEVAKALERKTKLARFVKELDKVMGLPELLVYAQYHKKLAANFLEIPDHKDFNQWNNARRSLSHPGLLKLYKELNAMRLRLAGVDVNADDDTPLSSKPLRLLPSWMPEWVFGGPRWSRQLLAAS
jgi:5'-deoxynucleotidase YfbR-like HD superfamily hydrolase